MAFGLSLKTVKLSTLALNKNEELLKQMLDMDEGARYLGEVALVPKNHQSIN